MLERTRSNRRYSCPRRLTTSQLLRHYRQKFFLPLFSCQPPNGAEPLQDCELMSAASCLMTEHLFNELVREELECYPDL